MEYQRILSRFIPVLRDINGNAIVDFSAKNPLKITRSVNHRPSFSLVRLGKTSILKDITALFNILPYKTLFSDPVSQRSILAVFRHTRVPKPLIAELDQIKHSHYSTYLHILAVSALTVKISLDVPHSHLDPQHAACLGLTHDVGKSRIPSAILEKIGPLTQEEFHIIQTHPVIEYHLMSYYFDHQNPRVAAMAFTHHERPDGSGYPRGIHRVNNYVQAIMPCDVFDALTSERPYRSSPYTPRSALNLLWEESCNGRMNQMFVMCLICYMRQQKPHFEELNVSSEQRDAPPLVNYYGMRAP